MSRSRIELRAMTAADVAAAARLSAAVGWPHRCEDWQMVLALGHGLVAVEGGAVIGTAMWWTFDDEVARIGMIIVDPARQQAGIGRRLMAEVFAATRGMTLQLDATEAGVPLYTRLGFCQVGEIMQHQGVVLPSSEHDSAKRWRLRPATAGDGAALIELDRQAKGGARASVLAALMRLGDGLVVEHEHGIEGFTFVRAFGRGHLAGPVVARNVEQAKALIEAVIETHRGRFLRIDARQEAGLGPWLVSRGLAPIAPAFTMVRGTRQAVVSPATCFAVVNQALG